MIEYLIVGQQMQQPYPQQYPQQQYPQQQMQRPAQPMPQAEPSGAVGMGTIVQWAGIAGAASGGVQAVLGIINGFDIIGFLMTVVIAAILGILTAILLGQFGSKVPIQGNLMVKAAMFMFVINLVVGFFFVFGEGALGVIIGIIGVGAGAFLYGWLVQKKIPNLI